MDYPQKVIELTNQERRKRGLGALRWNEQLFKAAQKHSINMGKYDFAGHVDHRNSPFYERVKAEGYSYKSTAENVAFGQSTPEQAVQCWMDSPGHRENILNPEFNEIGVGHHYEANDGGRVRYKHYWTQVFGKR